MIKKVKPGELIWCAENGAVNQVEVVANMYRCSNETGIKYPNDDVMRPWYCWNGYLFKSRKAAIRAAIKQTQKQIADEAVTIVFAQQHLSELEQQEQQLKSELEEAI